MDSNLSRARPILDALLVQGKTDHHSCLFLHTIFHHIGGLGRALEDGLANAAV